VIQTAELVQPGEHGIEALAQPRVRRPLNVLPVALVAGDDMKVKVKHVLLCLDS